MSGKQDKRTRRMVRKASEAIQLQALVEISDVRLRHRIKIAWRVLTRHYARVYGGNECNL
jgi:hypothetical protein